MASSAELGLIQDAQGAATAAAREAGRIQRDGFRVEREIRLKSSHRDIVTEVDLACEKAIVGLIAAEFPTHSILAEEGSAGGDNARYRWIVDPLDGTANFAQGLAWFCTSIALEIDGVLSVGVIYDAVHDELYSAARGQGAQLNGQSMHASTKDDLGEAVLVTSFFWEGAFPAVALRGIDRILHRARALRALGAAALNCATVAAGRLDGFWAHAGISPWDIAAGQVILTEAGGRLSHLDGRAYDMRSPGLLATNGPLHDALLRELALAGRSDEC
jgi:myo-inositol-1(or 4)-monophosphatase